MSIFGHLAVILMAIFFSIVIFNIAPFLIHFKVPDIHCLYLPPITVKQLARKGSELIVGRLNYRTNFESSLARDGIM